MREYYWIFKRLLKKIYLLIIFLLLMSFFVVELQPLELLVIQHLTQSVIRKISTNAKEIAIFVIIYIGIYIFTSMQPVFEKLISEIIQHRISKMLYGDLIQNLSKINLLYFDKEAYNIKIARARETVDGIAYSSLNNVVQLITGAAGLISISIIICNINVIYFILFTLISVVQNIYVASITNGNIALMKSQERKNRKHIYFFQLLYGRRHAKEIRSHRLYNWIESKRNDQFLEMEKEYLSFSKKWTIINSLWSIIMFMCEGMILILLIIQFKQNKLSVDSFVVIVRAYEMFISSVTSLVDVCAGIFRNSSYIKDFREIIEEPHLNMKIKHINENTIEMANVSFSYQPDKQILNDINLSIQKGEMIALVGHNGSGKTTLSKIMLKLLAIDSGTVAMKESRSSAVFQDFARFQFTLRENIVIGDLSSPNTSCDNYILTTMKKAQCANLVNELSAGLDTVLGREFETEGIDLSLGQWQKIAISRSIFKEADFIVFDEPTASLDPLAERRQFHYIQQFLKGKTVILVSHRIGLTKMADKIVYMKKGHITEVGTHNELMKLKREYYNFYRSQAKWYIE